MSTATITLTLPTTRADGTPFAAADYGGASIFANGTLLTTLAAPSLVATDAAVVPGVTVYTASIFDTQIPAVSSALSDAVTAPPLAVPPLAAPGSPNLSVTVV